MDFKVRNTEEFLNAIKTANTSDAKTTIFLESGEYEIESTIHIRGNVLIKGEGEVYLYGSKRIGFDKIKKINSLYKIELKDFGISDNGDFGMGPYNDFWKDYDIPKPHMDNEGPSLELYNNKKKMNISRYPKDGFLKIEKALGENSIFFNHERSGSKEGIFISSDTDFFKNENLSNILLVGYWNVDWAAQRHQIESFDEKTGAIKVKEPYHASGYRDGKCFTEEIGGKFYVINALTQVKNPGDWSIDREKNEIYFIPFENQTYIDVTLCENMFECENGGNIEIKNIEISRCRKSAFKFTNCNNVKIDNCKMYDVGAWGAILDWCENSVVSNCKVYSTGGGGIACSGGDRNTLKSSGNIVCNNEIHDIAYWHKTYLAAIEMNGVNVIARENTIYDVPHFGIVFQGNNHIIEKNHIKNACFESNDAGAIYAGRDYTCQGTVIRYNHLQDLVGYGGYGCLGIYFDDGMCSAEVYGNVLTNIPYAAILIGGGRNFDVHNNYFFDCKITVMFDNRLDTWSGGNSSLVKHLQDVDYKSEIWKKAYPYLYNVLDDEPTLPKYNKFYDNTIVGGDGIAMSNSEIEQYMQHYNNTFIKKDDNTPYIWHLTKWYYIDKE